MVGLTKTKTKKQKQKQKKNKKKKKKERIHHFFHETKQPLIFHTIEKVTSLLHHTIGVLNFNKKFVILHINYGKVH